MYQKQIEKAREKFTKEQRLVAFENEALEKRIKKLSAEIMDLYREKDGIRKFVSERVNDIEGSFAVQDESKSEVEIEEDQKGGRCCCQLDYIIVYG